MKSVAIGSALKSSSSPSLQPPLLATAVAYCDHKKVVVSRIQVRKTTTLGHCSSIFGRFIHLQSHKLNNPESANKYYIEVHRHQRRTTRILAVDASENLHGSDDLPQIDGKSFGATLEVIYRYSRGYAVQGRALSIVSVSLLAIQKLSDFTPLFFIGVLQAVIGGALATLYVTSINQLSDVDIDRINKPHLPLASGELSIKTGIRLTLLYAILGFCLGWSSKSWSLKLGLFLWYAFGTAYSVHLPLLRWKRDPMLAAMSIWSVHGAIVPILFSLHAQASIYGRPLFISKHILFVFGIMSIYAVVVALFKVFWLCVGLLEMVYAVAILIGLSSTRFWIRSIMVLGHGILGFILWREANFVDLKDNEAIQSFYMLIVKLNCAEHLLVPFLRF